MPNPPNSSPPAAPGTVDRFIARWQGREGGQERANYGLFLSELCDVLGVPRPEPASATAAENDYVFERTVKEAGPDGTAGTGRIDLYKKVGSVLAALARMGFVSTSDGGRTYLMRRAA